MNGKIGRNTLGNMLLAAAWPLFFASFFLPATDVVAMPGPEDAPLNGWQAMTSAVLTVAFQPIIIVADPRVLLFLVFPAVNVLMLIAPLRVWSSRECAVPLGIVFVVAGILPFLIPAMFFRNVFVGYYLWNASFFLMASACLLLGTSRYMIMWGHPNRVR